MRIRAANESDHRHVRPLSLDRLNDAGDRASRPAREFIGRQDARPAVENLNHFDAGVDRRIEAQQPPGRRQADRVDDLRGAGSPPDPESVDRVVAMLMGRGALERSIGGRD